MSCLTKQNHRNLNKSSRFEFNVYNLYVYTRNAIKKGFYLFFNDRPSKKRRMVVNSDSSSEEEEEEDEEENSKEEDEDSGESNEEEESEDDMDTGLTLQDDEDIALRLLQS